MEDKKPNTDDKKPKGTILTEGDKCGPEPPRPNYYSPQSVRERWNAWQICKAGAG